MNVAHVFRIVLVILSVATATTRGGAIIEVEEVVTTYTDPNNGANPLWCYGSNILVRLGQEVFLSVTETGKDIDRRCNTRWQLWHRTDAGWNMVNQEEDYWQREPCPIAALPNGPVFMSVNPSLQTPEAPHDACRPLVLVFDPKHPEATPRQEEPAWLAKPRFTYHSYRGFTVDTLRQEVLLLNIDAKTRAQQVSLRNAEGVWQAKKTIVFPIRSCYQQVALQNRAAHVLAIGDIVEPVEEWKKLKFAKFNRKWDYVFRRLFYTYTPDITTTPFIEPVELDTVEKTAGHITNLDLHIDTLGQAHVLYLKRPIQYDFMRDKYFIGQPMTCHLEYMVLQGSKVIQHRTLAETSSDAKDVVPTYGRFHVAANGDLYVVVAGNGPDGSSSSVFGNFIGRIGTGNDSQALVRLEMKHPFRTFFTNTPRGGSRPSDTIDLFGVSDDGPKLRYARVRLTARQ